MEPCPRAKCGLSYGFPKSSHSIFNATSAVSQPQAEPDLIEPSPTGRSRWFTEQVYVHDSQLKAYLHGSFPAVHDVDDVVQESYLRIWKAHARQSIRSAKAFLFQIARHVAMDLVRHQSSSPLQVVTDLDALSVLDSRPDAADVACSREEILLLADAIDALPARCREVFILRKIKRVPQREIGQILGISEQTVQVQVAKGMKRCERYLAQHGV